MGFKKKKMKELIPVTGQHVSIIQPYKYMRLGFVNGR
jgi:hypothetical protein